MVSAKVDTSWRNCGNIYPKIGFPTKTSQDHFGSYPIRYPTWVPKKPRMQFGLHFFLGLNLSRLPVKTDHR